MKIMEYIDSEYYSILWSREEYEKHLQEQYEICEKNNIKVRRIKKALRCVGWSSLSFNGISIYYFNSEPLALFSLGLSITCLIIVKKM